MKVIPSVSFKGNKPVITKNQRYVEYSKNGSKMDVWDVMDLLSGYDTIYFLDLDGIERRGLQSDILRKIGTRKEIWADVGARDTATITDAYIAGADKVVISTKTMYSKELIEESLKMSDEMIFCIDYKDGVISPSEKIKKYSTEELIRQATDNGIDTVVIHDLGSNDFDLNLIDYLPEREYELYIGGNIDIEKREDYEEGVDGVILGLEESIEWQNKN
ncbi:MAG: HisA/HisF-related TIM barrel protein [Candidatus Saliniplasma sp.]